jgi:hypothetical protein
MSVTPIKWHPKPERVDADPGATLTLDRSAWEQAGATFTPTDDGNGETPGLAAATVNTPAGPVEIGVVDYSEPSTYLLVPGTGPQRLLTTVAVLKTLESIGALEIQTDLLGLADVAPPPTLEDRVAELERQLLETGLVKNLKALDQLNVDIVALQDNDRPVTTHRSKRSARRSAAKKP